jgi:hypothetical protein
MGVSLESVGSRIQVSVGGPATGVCIYNST